MPHVYKHELWLFPCTKILTQMNNSYLFIGHTCLSKWLGISQLAFYVNLHRAVIGPSATLTGRWRPDIDLRRMLTGITRTSPASVAQLDTPSDWRPGGRGFNPRRGRQHSFVEIDHEIFSTVILSLPLIQEGQLSVSGERMCTILVNRLEDKACPVNVWLGKLTALDMTPLGWLGRKTSTQTNKQRLMLQLGNKKWASFWERGILESCIQNRMPLQNVGVIFLRPFKLRYSYI